jgi:hypothetical protein
MDLEKLTLPLEVADQAFNAGIKAATAGAAALVAGMGVAVKATFDWANSLDKLGDVMGGTNEQLAALNFVARKSGVGVDTLSRGAVILEKGLVKANGQLDTTGKALKTWGINVKDANGHLKDQTQLMGDIADRYSKFSTQQEKVNFLTEVFGKSGAELVDFFDTLASEGGIDAVTKKVNALGLAIDPNRYEQFNRNLEEMKLVGLGLAVGFTEQLMPAFEAVSSWAMNVGIPAIKNFGKGLSGAFKGGGLTGAADFVLGAFDNIDFASISQKIIDGINGIDWQQAGIDFSALVTRVKDSLVQFFTEVDWMGLGNSLASGLNNFVAGMFGVQGGEAGLQTLVQNKLAEISTEFSTWVTNIPFYLEGLGPGITDKVNGALSSMWSAITSKLAAAGASFRTWATVTVPASLASFASNITTSVTTALTTFAVQIDKKLTDVAKVFFDRGVRWANQAAAGFLSNLKTIEDAVSTLVGNVNKILNKIITSFTVNVQMGTVGGQAGSTHAHPPTQSPINVPTGAHAAGGSFMVPSSYGYEGFNLGGRDTASGGELIRITPRGQTDTVALDQGTINQLAERIAYYVAPAIIRAMNNV